MCSPVLVMTSPKATLKRWGTRGYGFIELDEHGDLPAAIGPPAA